MLDKSVCKACVKQREGKDVYSVHRKGMSVTFRGWGKTDDDFWNRGNIYCRFRNGIVGEVNGDPPDYCPFKVEHLMAIQNVE